MSSPMAVATISVPKAAGRVLSIWATDTANVANAVQWVQNNGDDQQWQLVPVGFYYKIVNRHAGKVLAVWQASTADGARVVPWSDIGALDQRRQLVQVSWPGAYHAGCMPRVVYCAGSTPVQVLV